MTLAEPPAFARALGGYDTVGEPLAFARVSNWSETGRTFRLCSVRTFSVCKVTVDFLDVKV
jgi:hypothetical protein